MDWSGLAKAAVMVAGIGTASLAAAQTNAASASNMPHATPTGNPADWFPADSYPPEAKAAGVQGRTAFLINVDAQGRVTGCNITTSSGSPLLDSTTCNLLVTNGRFQPAHDTKGDKVPGVWASAMLWQLTTAEPAPAEDADGGDTISPAEAYNEAVSAESKAASEQSDDQDQGQTHNQPPPDQDLTPPG